MDRTFSRRKLLQGVSGTTAATVAGCGMFTADEQTESAGSRRVYEIDMTGVSASRREAFFRLRAKMNDYDESRFSTLSPLHLQTTDGVKLQRLMPDQKRNTYRQVGIELAIGIGSELVPIPGIGLVPTVLETVRKIEKERDSKPTHLTMDFTGSTGRAVEYVIWITADRPVSRWANHLKVYYEYVPAGKEGDTLQTRPLFDPDFSLPVCESGGGTPEATPTRTPTAAPPSAEPTTIDRELSSEAVFAISNADDDGNLHVAYSRDGQLWYARVATRGDVVGRQRLDTPSGKLREVSVAAEADGHAHVLAYSERGDNAETIERFIIAPNGESTAHTVESTSDERIILTCLRGGHSSTVIAGDRLVTVVEREPPGAEASVEMWLLDLRKPSRTVRTLDVQARYGVCDGVALAASDDVVYLAYALGRKLTGPGPLGFGVYTVDADGVTPEVAHTTDSQGTYENWRLPAVAVDADGRGVVAFAGGPRGSFERSAVVTFDPTSGDVTRTLYEGSPEMPADGLWHADLLFDGRGRLVVALRDAYRVYDRQFDAVETAEVPLGHVTLGRNGTGGTSLLGVTGDGRLRYRPL